MTLPTASPWDPAWFTQGLAPAAAALWRGVEAQHVVATMRLVDSLDEQALLEQLLERSKPALPPAVPPGLHYLLATPFRYRPRQGSRFRAAGSRGIWYGAEALRTACAEVAYWRWRFVCDSRGLAGAELLTEHTFFNARVQGLALDLSGPPWSAAAAAWTDPQDYRATQALAEAAQAHGVAWIRYRSVRDPGGHCGAVLQPQALGGLDLAGQQTWHCRATARSVRFVHHSQRFEWRFDGEPDPAPGPGPDPGPDPSPGPGAGAPADR